MALAPTWATWFTTFDKQTRPAATATGSMLLQADPKLGDRERKLLATIYRELVAPT
jgi:hypothetical protein